MHETHDTGLNKIFDHPNKKDLGRTREVWEAHGKEGTDFIVKNRQGNIELEILRFLSESGISEKLLAYDEKTLVLSKIDGVEIGDYLYDLVNKHPKKVVTVTTPPAQMDASRIKVIREEVSHLPTSSVLEKGEIRKFYTDYVSKAITLVLCGILHRDIKIDNIMVTPQGETNFIDFGVSMKVERGTKPNIHRAWDEVNELLKILEKLNPAFHDHLPIMGSINSWWKIFEELYSKFGQGSLEERPKIVLEILNDNQLKNLLQEMRFDEEFIPEIETRIITLLQSLSR